jgi:general secretion pathway protein B
MSYILDALRKSDQQRQRGAAPTLHAGQAAAQAPKQPAFLAYGLLAAVLVGAGMVIGWLRPWQAEQAAPGRAELVAAKPLESTPRQLPPAPSEMAPQRKPEPQLQNAAPTAQAAPAPALVPAKPPRPARAKPEPRSAPPAADGALPARTAAPTPAVGTAADAARVQTVISMAELPLALQQELPPMTISVHAYSGNPGDRLVGINNRTLREGEYVVPGLKLEQITPEGMIFGYKGYSFRRGVK